MFTALDMAESQMRQLNLTSLSSKSWSCRKKTRLRPLKFLMDMYLHTQSRYKGDEYNVAQTSSGRKKGLRTAFVKR